MKDFFDCEELTLSNSSLKLFNSGETSGSNGHLVNVTKGDKAVRDSNFASVSSRSTNITETPSTTSEEPDVTRDRKYSFYSQRSTFSRISPVTPC